MKKVVKTKKKPSTFIFENLPELQDKDFQFDFGWEDVVKCECGSESTYGKGTNLHSDYCPKYRK